MPNQDNLAVVHYGGNELWVGITPSGHSVTLDTNHDRNVAPTPVELLLVALGSCTGVDVIGILEKKRQRIVDYKIEVRGTRRDEHPRKYTRMEVKHIIRGQNVSEKAVIQAIELSEDKYCSVAATFKPTVEIVSTYEIIEVED